MLGNVFGLVPPLRHMEQLPTTFSLSRAVPGDARQLAEVAARAFAHDAHTQVKAAVRPPGDFAELYEAGAAAIFPPGSVIADSAVELIGKLADTLGLELPGATAN